MVHQVFHLTRYELATLQDLEEHVITAERGRCVWICGKDDTWGPPPLMDNLTRLCGAERVRYVPELKHAFVVNGSQAMAEIVAPLIRSQL